MKFNKLYAACAVLILTASLPLAGIVGAADIGTTLDKACTQCHSAKRICLNLGAKNEAAWKLTVANMVRKGAQLPASQIDAAAGYLGGLKPGQGPLCD